MILLSLLNSPIELLAVIVGFLLIGIPIHEFAHAYVANKYGDPTAKLEGRLTLNPLAHLDPMGLVFFFMIGFGWGKPVPVNPRLFKSEKDDLKVSIAGIVANLLVAFILGIPIRIAILQGHLIDSSIYLSFIDYVLVINIMLAVFNILPIPPLDGSHFIEYFLSDEQKIAFANYGQYILLGIILLGLTSGISILSIIIEPMIRVVHWVMIGTSGGFL